MSYLQNTAFRIQGLPYRVISSDKYVVRFAQNREELKAVQRLRFQVFNIVMGEGLVASYLNERDVDPFDEQCHHLLVVERSSEEIIGTYRVQTYQIAQNNKGYYTNQEFDLDCLPKEMLAESAEVGRACIRKDHRNGRVLFLLWRGLAKYMMHTGCRYLLGCCSISSQNVVKAWQVMEFLKRNDHMHENIYVETYPKFRCKPIDVNPDYKKIKLPHLFRLYMNLNAKVCSEPALDREFQTIDYLVILDTNLLDERMRTLFFK